MGETRLVIETTEQAELRQPEVVALPAAAREALPAVVEDKPPRSLEDPSGHALDPFFAALYAVERKDPGAIARVTYYGDSIVASDFVTATLRRRLQKRFGDAGHGFMLMANPWPGYFHNDVVRFAAPGWKVSRVVGPFAQGRPLRPRRRLLPIRGPRPLLALRHHHERHLRPQRLALRPRLPGAARAAAPSA